MSDIHDVRLSKAAIRDIKKIPIHVKIKLFAWIDDVGSRGLNEIKKIPGYHDEPLKGKRKGQRSIRLSKGYRAIYEIRQDGSINFIEIEEVNKHDY